MPDLDLLNAITVIHDPTPQQFEEIFELRMRAWRGQARFKDGIVTGSDRWDPVSSHRVFVDDEGRIAGAYRFSLHQDLDDLPDGGVWVTDFHDAPGPHAYASRLFVNREFHGAGWSRRADALVISEALRAGAQTVTCLAGSVSAGLRRLPQMERRGWTRIGVATKNSPDTFWIAEHLPVILAATRAKS